MIAKRLGPERIAFKALKSRQTSNEIKRRAVSTVIVPAVNPIAVGRISSDIPRLMISNHSIDSVCVRGSHAVVQLGACAHAP